MQIDIRTIIDAEIPAWCAAVNTGFLNPAGDIDAEARRPGIVLDRTWGGFDGDRVDAFAGRLRNPPQGTVEFVDRDTARALAPPVFERHRAQRPGEISRTDRYWDIDFGIVRYPSWKEPKAGFYVAGRDGAGDVVGV